jgi:hypothetical protein
MLRALTDRSGILVGRRRFLVATAAIGLAGVGSGLLRPRPVAADGLPAANSELTLNVAAGGATLTIGGQSGSVDLSGKLKVKVVKAQQASNVVLKIEAFAMTGNGKQGEVDLVEASPDRSQPTTLELTQPSPATYKLTLNIDFLVAVKTSDGKPQALQSKQPVTYTADGMSSFPPSGQQLQGPSSVDLVSPDKMDTVVGQLSSVSIKLG